MPNDTRNGLKINGSGSYGVMNPPQSPGLNIIERECNNWQPTSEKRALEMPFRKPGKLSLEVYLRKLKESLSEMVQAVSKTKCARIILLHSTLRTYGQSEKYE